MTTLLLCIGLPLALLLLIYISGKQGPAPPDEPDDDDEYAFMDAVLWDE